MLAVSLLLLFVDLALWTGCSRETLTHPPIIAMVNGEAISMDEFKSVLAVMGPGNETHANPEEFKSLSEEVLDQLIEKKLLLQEARLRGIQASKEEAQIAIQQMKGDYSGEVFNELLKSSGLTPEQWKQNVTENLIINKLIDTVTQATSNISDDQVKSYYKKYRTEFKKKKDVRARQIVLATEEEAKTIHDQLLNGADFAALAVEKSISPDKALGGDLGYFAKGQMPEEFDIVFKLKVNDISPIVKSSYGYHIFKVEDKRAARIQLFKEVQNEIYQKLKNEKQDQLRGEISGDPQV